MRERVDREFGKHGDVSDTRVERVRHAEPQSIPRQACDVSDVTKSLAPASSVMDQLSPDNPRFTEGGETPSLERHVQSTHPWLLATHSAPGVGSPSSGTRTRPASTDTQTVT